MTMCIGVLLDDAVVLAADGRRTIVGTGGHDDNCQKLVRITDTLWSAGAGNLALTSYLQAVLAERAPDDVYLYLQAAVQPFAQATLAAHTALYERLAVGNPGQVNLAVMSVLLVGGFDRTHGKVLCGIASGDGFELRLAAGPPLCIGGRPQDQQHAAVVLSTALAGGTPTPDRVADGCQAALRAVADVNPEIGPTGHAVIVTRDSSDLRPF